MSDTNRYFVPGNTFKVGDVVSTDMRDHIVNSGPCKDWIVGGKFPAQITSEQFYKLLQASLRSEDRGNLVMNRCAYLVTQIMCRCEDSVKSMLVIYRYDETYWISQFVSPKDFVKG